MDVRVTEARSLEPDDHLAGSGVGMGRSSMTSAW